MFDKLKSILFRRRNENIKAFYYGLVISICLFALGIIYIVCPYLIDSSYINVNNYFIVIIGFFGLANLLKFLIYDNKMNEKVYLCLGSCLVGILNIILSGFLASDLVFVMSISIFTLIVCGVKLFTINYYYERNDSYWYVETMLTVIFVIVGATISFTVIENSSYELLELGFFVIIISILDLIGNSIRCMLRAPRFIRNIRLK